MTRKNIPKSSKKKKIEHVLTILKNEIARIISIESSSIDEDASFLDLGINSVFSVDLIHNLNEALSIELGVEKIFDYTTPKLLTEHIVSGHGEKIISNDKKRPKAAPATEEKKSKRKVKEQTSNSNERVIFEPFDESDDIAVIGISGRFAGADSPEHFWQVLEQGESLITECEREGWNTTQFYDSDPEKEDRSVSKWGGFLSSIDEYDPLFFNISPKEAERMDPQQRIILEEAYKAFEDSGYPEKQLSGMNVGVFIGARSSEYKELILKKNHIHSHTFLGNDMSILAGKISYYFNLHGTCLAIDTACSSSLAAVHLACESIKRGESDMALAGAVFVMPSPEFYIMASKTGMLTPCGESQSFNENADGMIPGEGAAAIILKKMSEALRDGDHIYGVIKGSATNHNGRTQGITAPNTLFQKKLIRDLYYTANIDPESISYIETQTSGTSLGDLLEYTALKESFESLTDKKHFCVIGTHKPNIGHSMAVSGLAGLIKVLMSMKHKMLPPTIGIHAVNSKISFKDSPFVLGTKRRIWQGEEGEPLRAGVSSFGFNGTNAHIILEEAPSAYQENLKQKREFISPLCIFPFSAKTQTALEQKIKDFAVWLEQEGERHEFIDIAYTLQVRMNHYACRKAFVVRERSELVTVLRNEMSKSSDTLPRKKETGDSVEALVEDIRQSLSNDPDTCAEKIVMLAEAYTRGANPEWETFYVGRWFHHVPLPAYPFDRKKYWVPQGQKRAAKQASTGSLLRRNNISPGLRPELYCTKKFYSKLPLLQDHIVRGCQIMPGSLFLDLVYEVASSIFPDEHFVFKNIMFLAPFICNKEEPEVVLRVAEEGHNTIFEITSGTEAEKVTHCRGDIAFGSSVRQSTTPIVDMDEIVSRSIRRYTCKDIYPMFQLSSLHYGAYYQLLTNVWCMDKEVLGLIEIDDARHSHSDMYTLHPGQLDAVFQVLHVMNMTADSTGEKNPGVLFAIGEMEIFAPFGGSLYSYAQDNGNNRYTLHVYDERHNLCASFHDVVLREFIPDRNSKVITGGSGEKSILEQVMTRYAIPLLPGERRAHIRNAFELLESFALLLGLKIFRKFGFFQRSGEEYATDRLHEQLGILPQYSGWLSSLLRILAEKEYLVLTKTTCRTSSSIEKEAINEALREIEHTKNRLLQEPSVQAYAALLWECYTHAERVLKGEVKATDIMFPGSSTELVAGIYKGNESADYCNRIVAWSVQSYSKEILANSTGNEKIRILEIGAGVGSTSEVVFSYLHEFHEHLVYTYTDISFAFTHYGRQHYGHENPYVEFKVLDIEKEIREQGYLPGSYDIIIATNVLHATADIKKTLANTASLLKTNGWLIVNEITSSLTALTLTMGFLDGWWLFRDAENRIAGSPLLSPETWRGVLEQTGFAGTTFLGGDTSGSGSTHQHVIIAEKQHLEHEVPDSYYSEHGTIPSRDLADPVIVKRVDYSPADSTQPGIRQHVRQSIIAVLMEILGLDTASINAEKQFSEYGVDSLTGAALIKELNTLLSISLGATVLFDYTNIDLLSDYILDAFGEQLVPSDRHVFQPEGPEVTRDAEQEEIPDANHSEVATLSDRKAGAGIAIVGISCRFAGAEDKEAFWSTIAEGKVAISEVPSDRWDHKAYYDPDNSKKTKTSCKWGGFLEQIDQFDPLFFNISGKEAELADPQQRLLLEESWRALEDAGYANEATIPQNCAVYIGSVGGDYLMKTEEELGELDAYSALGNYNSILSARIAYFLNLKGPNMTIDTACSSSLVSVDLACRSLLSGESEMALAGGVFIAVTPRFYIMNSNIGALSHDGVCRAFDDKANGFVPGEGVGVLVLKKLESALRDHDHIYGVIKGSGVNHDGRTNGITAPSTRSQTELELSVYGASGISPDTISYVEAHGTGTRLGDPIEINALTNAFRKYTERKNYCAIGSVKPNIGHTVAVSGIAGLIKVLMAMQYKQLPPAVHFDEPNKLIDFERSPFYVNTRLKDWDTERGLPRRATVSSFGFSGTNAHVVVEEAPAASQQQTHGGAAAGMAPSIVILSARNEFSLKQYAEHCVAFLEGRSHSPHLTLSGCAYTLQVGRKELDERLALVANNLEELMSGLSRYSKGEKNIPNLYQGNCDKDDFSINNIIQEDGEEIVQVLVRKKKYHKLAQLWVHGLKVNWHLLYDGVLPGRVSLPPVPFCRKRYWIRKKEGHDVVDSITEKRVSLFSDAEVQLSYIQSLVPAPAQLLEKREDEMARSILLFHAGNADALINAFTERHCDATCVVSDLRHDTIFEVVQSSQPELIYFLGGISLEEQITTESATYEAASQHGVYAFFHIVKALQQVARAKRPIKIKIITNNVYQVLNESSINYPGASLHGFAASIAREHPLWNIALFDISLDDLDSEEQNNLLDYITQMPVVGVAPISIMRSGSLYQPKLMPVMLPAVKETIFKTEGVYWIAGGMGGIGMELSRFLAKSVRARLVLSGRSALNETIKRKIAGLEAAGARVLYISADATNPKAMAKAAEEAKAVFGRIDGAIYAAVTVRLEKVNTMSEAAFIETLEVKTGGSLTFYQALQDEPLDFLLYFSSSESFANDAALSSYVAGSYFQDKLAAYLDRQHSYPVRSLNWGYWGEIGIGDHQGNAFHQQTLARGYRVLSLEEATDYLQRVTESPFPQVMVLKAETSLLHDLQVDAFSRATYFPDARSLPETDHKVVPHLPEIDPLKLDKIADSIRLVEKYSRYYLLKRIQDLGFFKKSHEQYSMDIIFEMMGIIPAYHIWGSMLKQVLIDEGFLYVHEGMIHTSEKIEHPETVQRLASLAEQTHTLKHDPEVGAWVELLEVCFAALPAIVRGEVKATEVLFPSGSFSLVDRVYRDNYLSDFFNAHVVRLLISHIEQKLPLLQEDEKIQILEIGAGTGSTSKLIFESLLPYAANVVYYYTDISLGFVNYGKRNFSSDYPYAVFKNLDIEHDIEKQGFLPGSYDVVIATNVLHTTSNIRSALERTKMLLRTHGWLILNELTRIKDCIMLSFGLLNGWWQYEERDLRIDGSPLIAAENWKKILQEEGFEGIECFGIPGSYENLIGQHVLLGVSNGIVKIVSGEPAIPHAAEVSFTEKTGDDTLPLRIKEVEESIITIVADCVQIDRDEIGLSTPYTELGVDSILALDIIQAINARLKLHLRPTDLFNYATIGRLSEYIATNESFQKKYNETIHHKETKRVTATKSSTDLVGLVAEKIRAIVADCVQIDRDEIGLSTPYTELGVDSILALEIIQAINNSLALKLRPTDLFSYATVDQLATYIVQECGYTHKEEQHAIESSQRLDEMKIETSIKGDAPVVKNLAGRRDNHSAHQGEMEIAIVGMSGKFPQADDLGQFWSNLASGKDCITETPRWDIDTYYDPEPGKPGKTYNKWGGFLSDIEMFDPLFFNISPKEAELMDPQQRLFLEESWKAIEDAGYASQSLDGRKIGVYLGFNAAYYAKLIDKQQIDHDAYTLIGNNEAILAARISYFLNLHGPTLTINTACSSSLVAIHLACESIRSGSCEAALAGGVMTLHQPDFYIQASSGGMLSAGNICTPFDQRADGFIPGEGVATIFLKPLVRAIEDGDHVYGIIAGSGINQDGRTNGITAPSALSQTALEREVYQQSGVHPEQITYIETHGTGTKLGDPIEFDALTDAFRTYTGKKQYCALGSVKSNIGHTLAAAGMAGIIKILLCFKHKQLVPSLHYEKGNEFINFEDSPFYVNTALRSWDTIDGSPRYAAISAFGLSGTNAHMILREPLETPVSVATGTQPFYLIPLSARTRAELEQKIIDLKQWLEGQGQDYALADISFTLLEGRTHFAVRGVCSVASKEELIDNLSSLLEGEENFPYYRTNEINEKHFRPEPALQELATQLVEDLAGGTLAESDYREKITTLGDLYTKGYSIAGKKLYGRDMVRRISMPVYPFKRERCWLPDHKKTEGPSVIRKIHPMLDENRSTFWEQKFAANFSGNEFYLRDHLVHNRKILPGVAYLELARAAAASSAGTEVSRIKNIVWAQPVIVDSAPTTIEIILSPSDHMVRYEILSASKDEEPLLCSQGKIEFGSKIVQPDSLPVEDIRARATGSYTRDTWYEDFSRIGLCYGPSFQVVEALWYNEDEALSRLVLPDAYRDPFSGYVLHPALMDGGLQTVMALVSQQQAGQALYLPFAIGEVECFASLPVACYAHVTRSLSSQENSEIRRFNIIITDNKGEVLVRIKDFSAREYRKPEDETARNNKKKSIYFTRKWSSRQIDPLQQLPQERKKLFIFSNEAIDAYPLQLQDTQVVRVVEGNGFAQTAADLFQVCPAEKKDYIQLFDAVRANGDFPDSIIYLWPLQHKAGTIDEQQEAPLFAMLSFVQALMEVGLPSPVSLLFVYKNDTTYYSASCAALSGFFKTLQLEDHRFSFKTVALEGPVRNASDVMRAYGSMLYAELTQNEHEIMYKRDVRYVATLQEYRNTPLGQQLPLLKENSVYLITGGTGGVGMLLARYLLCHLKCSVVLSGRSLYSDEKKKQLETLKALGGDVSYIPADIAVPDAVENLIEEILKRHGRLNGIFHCAGVLQDALISKKDFRDVQKVLAPKVTGTRLLDAATLHLELDFIVLFSSTSAVIGNIGQADYAYANGFMDYYALHTEQVRLSGKRNTRVISINWPLWEEGGMQVDKETFDWLGKRFGLEALSTEDGIKACSLALESGEPNLAVFSGKREMIKKQLLGLSSVKEKTATTVDSSSRKETIETRLLHLFAELLKVRVDDIDSEEELSSYGLDSIMMMTVMNRLEEMYQAVIEPSILVQYNTIRTLAGYLLENHALREASEGPVDEEVDDTRARVEERLLHLFAELLKVRVKDIDSEEELSSYGLDSIMMMTVMNRLEEMYQVVIEPNLLVQYNTIRALSEYLVDTLEIREKPAALSSAAMNVPLKEAKKEIDFSSRKSFTRIMDRGTNTTGKIAVISLACRFPGSKNPEAYWKNLNEGRNLVREVPEKRWNLSAYYSPDRNAADKSYSKWGGFLDEIYAFDARYFGIEDNDALLMDPHHRILLELSEELFLRGGYTRDDLSGSRTAIYIGGGESPYIKKNTEEIQSGNLKRLLVNTIQPMMAARIADYYNLRGACQTIDTACSSSLVALHHACQDLLHGECDMAVAGGVELLVGPYLHIAFSKAEVLSEYGYSAVFDENASGFVLGEGAGLILLKPYEQAVADGDHIEAVILGSAVNNDGHTMGLTVPSLEGQQDVMRAALEKSGVSADSISYLEAHGTGTLLGDPIEIKAASNVFRDYTNETQFCAVGSVKSNMGHLLRAAGSASFIKVVQALKHGCIPPTLHCQKPHPRFQFAESPFYPAVSTEKWQPRHEVRRAGISSFGFGGTNCHMIVEAFQADAMYERKRFPLPMPKFRPDYYCLGEPIRRYHDYHDIDGIEVMRLLEALKEGNVEQEQVVQVIGS